MGVFGVETAKSFHFFLLFFGTAILAGEAGRRATKRAAVACGAPGQVPEAVSFLMRKDYEPGIVENRR
jgi:hypothetical protein